MAAGKKRSLLGQHRADDEEYWEHFTDGMVLPGVQITNDEEGWKQEVEDEAAYYTYKDSDYYMKVIAPELRLATCWDLFRAWIGYPQLHVFESGQDDDEYVYEALERHNQLRKVHSAAPLTLDMEMCAMARKIVLNYASRGKSDGKPSSHTRDRTVEEGDKLCSETLLYTEGWPGRTYMTGYQATQNAYDFRRSGRHRGNKTSYKKYLAVIWKSVTRLGVARLTVLTHSYNRWKESGSKRSIERTYVVFLYFPEIQTGHGRLVAANVELAKKVQSIVKRDSVGAKSIKSGVSIVARESLVSGVVKSAVSLEQSHEQKKSPIKKRPEKDSKIQNNNLLSPTMQPQTTPETELKLGGKTTTEDLNVTKQIRKIRVHPTARSYRQNSLPT